MTLHSMIQFEQIILHSEGKVHTQKHSNRLKYLVSLQIILVNQLLDP